jgi:hypothetical protein
LRQGPPRYIARLAVPETVFLLSFILIQQLALYELILKPEPLPQRGSCARFPAAA